MVRFADTPAYEDKERKIAFIRNLDDYPDGYYVRLGEESDDRGFAIPSRVLPDLTRPETTTETMERMMDAMDRGLMNYIQEFSGIRSIEFHYHLFRLRNEELEKELEYFDSETFSSEKLTKLDASKDLKQIMKQRDATANLLLRRRVRDLERAISDAIRKRTLEIPS